tara:strand:- start:8537 stop:9952 length:1416 start_codon:yes stop_codon:yes gene_type:complete
MIRPVHVLYKWIGFLFAAIVSIIGAVLGWYEEISAQYILFYSIATFAIILWGWHHFSVRWVYKLDGISLDTIRAEDKVESIDEEMTHLSTGGYIKGLAFQYKSVIIAIILLAILFLIVSFAVDDFFQAQNIIATLVFAAFIAFAAVLNKFVTEGKSAFIGVTVLLGLFVIGSLVVDGFFSTANVKSMLVFASFLGLACVGQTMVVLLGGLDLSIPFVIGSANVALMYLFGLGLPPWFAVLIIIFLGMGIGLISGLLSFRLQGQALIVTLGVGFAVAGGTQILTSIGSRYSGNVFGTVPDWLTNIAAMNGQTFGLDFPPVIVIWLAVAILLTIGMRNTSFGRNLYALGGSRIAAKRLSISEWKYWVGVYTISGGVSALTGVLLLGWSGGGFIGVGDPYLFMTLAAVVVGGTSLLGGWGGYGFTIIGVLVLQVLTSFLVGLGLSFEGQQFVFGLLILPMVAMYGRSPHIRTQI